MDAKRAEYAAYLISANAVRDFNKSLITPSIFDVILSGKKATDPKTMPARPTSYLGDTFVGTGATESQGGYGVKTSGMYSVKATTASGYKPFGALGQGTSTDMAIALDTSNKSRVMLVTVMQKILTDNSAFTKTLTLGAYGWNAIDFTTPTVPAEPVALGALTLFLSASLTAPLVAMSLF